MLHIPDFSGKNKERQCAQWFNGAKPWHASGNDWEDTLSSLEREGFEIIARRVVEPMADDIHWTKPREFVLAIHPKLSLIAALDSMRATSTVLTSTGSGLLERALALLV